MVLHAKGDWKLSARDLGVADKQLVLLDIARDPGQIGKWIFSDSAGKYHAPPSEKLALNAFNLLNYLMLGDLSGARVEAKRFTVTREYLATTDNGKDAHGAFGSYLAGFTYERLGEVDEALRYYDEALQQADFASLRAPIARLAARSGFRTPRIRALLGEPEAPAAAAAPDHHPARPDPLPRTSPRGHPPPHLSPAPPRPTASCWS
jgi:tetratricopeptide (TPR) repeat protein